MACYRGRAQAGTQLTQSLSGFPEQSVMTIAEFIDGNLEEILCEWESFARTLLPSAEGMSPDELRDHAKQMLQAIAADLRKSQTAEEQLQKSLGKSDNLSAPTAAADHGQGREASGFTVTQLTAEFRALRASVLKLWQQKRGPVTDEVLDDLIRFNEAIDQALFHSVVPFSEHTKKTRDTFLAMLGHDLRAPLSTIAVAAEFLGKPTLRREDVLATSARLKRSAATMTAMVHDLLEYARSQLGGTMPLKIAPQSLRSIAEAALHDCQSAFSDCPFELETSGDLIASVDGNRMQQLLSNLVTNACQYRDRSYRVTLSVEGREHDVLMQVKNRGGTIPESSFKAIFNPLVQLANETVGERPSTSLGLGLHIARLITEAHGGVISLTSSEKHGTVFSVRIPRTPIQQIVDPIGT